MTDFRKISENDHIPIIRKDTEVYIANLINKKGLVKILEYGTAIGYSASFFDDINERTKVYSIEKDEYAFEIAKHNIDVLSKNERVQLLHGDGLKATDEIKESFGEDFDLIFIDGGKSHYMELMREAIRLCKKGGYILSDDIWQRGLTKLNPGEAKRKHRTSMRNMQAYLDYITTIPELSTEILDIGDGLAVSRYIYEHEEN